MSISMDNIGSRIRNRRKELKMTQTDVYKKCGITSGALSQIENGIRVPSAIIFYSISQALRCSMDYLMTGEPSGTEDLVISECENKLLEGYRTLPEEDQQELLEILELKLRKATKGKNTAAKSSRLKDQSEPDMAG